MWITWMGMVCNTHGVESKYVRFRERPEWKLVLATCEGRWKVSVIVDIKAWESNPQPASMYYVARGHICKLCMYCKNYTLI
jgi:hypothetical protein